MYTNDKPSRFGRAFKLFLCFFVAALVALAFGYIFSAKYIEGEAENQVVQEARLYNTVFKSDFLNYLNSLKNEIVAFSSNPAMKKLVADMADSYSRIGPDAAKILVKKYGKSVPTEAAPTQENTPIPTPADQSVDAALAFYDSLYSTYDPIFADLEKSLYLYDVQIIDPHGTVLYSREKYGDFTVDIATDEKWKDSNLALIFKDASGLKSGEVVLHDVKPYSVYGAADNSIPSSLMATPIINDGSLLGVLVFRLSFVPHPATFNYQGMLKNGENIYIIGNDNKVSHSINSMPFKRELLGIGRDSFIVEVDQDEKKGVAMEKAKFLGNSWQIVTELNLDARVQDTSDLKEKLLYKYAGIVAASAVFFLCLSLLFCRKSGEVTEAQQKIRYYR